MFYLSSHDWSYLPPHERSCSIYYYDYIYIYIYKIIYDLAVTLISSMNSDSCHKGAGMGLASCPGRPIGTTLEIEHPDQ